MKTRKNNQPVQKKKKETTAGAKESG